MKKLLFLLLSLLYISCEIGPSGAMLLYDFKVTLETDLEYLEISTRKLDSTTVYPYLLFEASLPVSTVATIYPVNDTGYIQFKLYGAVGYETPAELPLLDSLIVYTPIDTTIVLFCTDANSDTIFVVNNLRSRCP